MTPNEERGAGAWTTVGNLGSPHRAVVDPAGHVGPTAGGWWLDWSVGAEDRWHHPSDSANVRQVLIGDAPVVETRMRVPGGDVIHRAYAMKATVADGGGDLVVVEVENDSAVPVAIGFGVRAEAQVALDGHTVTVGGRPCMVLPREPNEVRETEPGRTEHVYPLPHSATVRVVVPLLAESLPRRGPFRRPGPEPTVSHPASVPTPDQVAAGWKAQTDRGLRLVLPDERLQSAVDANRRYLLLFHDGESGTAAPLLAALDRFGFHREVAEVLVSYPDRQQSDGQLATDDGTAAALWAMAHHWDLTRNDALAEQSALTVSGAAEWLARKATDLPSSPAGLRAGARLLRAAGEHDAAAQTEQLVTDDDTTGWGADAVGVLDRVESMIADASPTWTWSSPRTGHDGVVGAEFLSSVRSMLVQENDDGVALLTEVPTRWYGQGIEVHDAPTRRGTVSFGIRWHGERPALLWEIELHDPADGIVITCPGLDPTWRTTEARGETLLAAPVSPSAGPQGSGPDQGESFG